MSQEEWERQLKDIAAIAKKQREGAYTTQSDACQALMLVERLALLMSGVLAEEGGAR